MTPTKHPKPLDDLALLLTSMRQRAGYESQRQASIQTGIPLSTIRGAESGRSPAWSTVERLAAAYGWRAVVDIEGRSIGFEPLPKTPRPAKRQKGNDHDRRGEDR